MGSFDFAVEAAEDARAAIRFLRKHATTFRVDPEKITLSGYSAGAVTAMAVGYTQMAAHEGESGNSGYDSKPNLVVAWAGSLATQGYCAVIDPEPADCQIGSPLYHFTNDITGVDQPPLITIHGTQDFIVPYKGSQMAHDRAEAVGLPHHLITIEGGDHYFPASTDLFYDVWWGSEMLVKMTEYLQITDTCANPF